MTRSAICAAGLERVTGAGSKGAPMLGRHIAEVDEVGGRPQAVIRYHRSDNL